MINTCYPARIISFDATTQTATVKLMIEKIFSDLDSDYQVDSAAEIVDVPCHFPKGGGHSITMPVVAGDDCLVFFAQRGIEHWLYEGIEEAGLLFNKPSPQHKRRHSQSDAVALIGFGSGIVAEEPKVISEFNTNAIEIRNVDRTQRISLLVDTKDIEVVTDTNVTATVGGNVTATVGGSVEATIEGELTANVTGNTTIVSPTITLDGNVIVTGTSNLQGVVSADSNIDCSATVTATTDCVGGGISLKGHIHNYDNPPKPTTPPV